MSEQRKRISLDEAFSKDIASAVYTSMRDTFGLKISIGVTQYGEGAAPLEGDISGIIGLVQDELDGTLVLYMSFEGMRDIVPHALGKTVSVTQETAVDAVAELTNMVFCQIKSALNQRNFEIKLGTPCVVTGKGHFVCQFHRGKHMIVPFHVEGKLFQVYVALHGSPKETGGRG